MSQIVLSSNNTGTAQYTIAAPGTSTNRTLTLPDQTGTILTNTGPYSANASAPAGAATIDSSGNLGLGVTPSAWSGAYKALQLPNGGAIANDGTQSIYIGQNWYGNAGNKYITTAAASLYLQGTGAHQWYTAPSGTAGNAITFTQNMGLSSTSLDVNSGYVKIGSPATSTDEFWLQPGSVEFALRGRQAKAMTFYTSDTERARITSGGEVYIAGTTDQGAYNLQVNGTGVWGAGAYVNGSDERLKNNIQTLNDGLAVVTQLRPVTFQYKPEHSKDQNVQPGFIAQELQQAMAGKDYVDGVVITGPEYLNVAYQNLIPILTKAIQEQQALITALTARIEALEAK